MPYTKTNWVDGTTEITSAALNNLESQHELALVDARAASVNPLKVQIVSSLPAAGTAGRVVFNTGDNKFYFDTGAAWNVAAVANIGQQTITPTTSNITITEGYHNGTGYAEGDADLVAGNIKDGVTIFGVTGNYTPSLGTTSSGFGYTVSSLPTTRSRTITMGSSGRLYWTVFLGSFGVNLRYTITVDGTITHDYVQLSSDSYVFLYGDKSVGAGSRTVAVDVEREGGGSGDVKNGMFVNGSWVNL